MSMWSRESMLCGWRVECWIECCSGVRLGRRWSCGCCCSCWWEESPLLFSDGGVRRGADAGALLLHLLLHEIFRVLRWLLFFLQRNDIVSPIEIHQWCCILFCFGGGDEMEVDEGRSFVVSYLGCLDAIAPPAESSRILIVVTSSFENILS